MDRLPLLRVRAVALLSELCRKRVSRSQNDLVNRSSRFARFCRRPSAAAAAILMTATTIEAPSAVGPKPISTPVRPSTCTRRASVRGNNVVLRRRRRRRRDRLGLWGRMNLRDWTSRMRSTERSRQVDRSLTTRPSLMTDMVGTTRIRMEKARSHPPAARRAETRGLADRSAGRGEKACLYSSACCNFFFAWSFASCLSEHLTVV